MGGDPISGHHELLRWVYSRTSLEIIRALMNRRRQ